MIIPMLLLEMNSLMGWGLLELQDRTSHGLAMALGLVWFIFVSPHWADSRVAYAGDGARDSGADDSSSAEK
jgi:hypothetical protein